MSQLFRNNAKSRLVFPSGSSLGTAAPATFTVTTDTGRFFPTTLAEDADHFLVTLESADGTREVVKVTAHAALSDTFTISERAVEDVDESPRVAHDFVNDDFVELRLTAGFITNIAKGSIVYVIDGGGAVITAGMKGFIEAPFSGSINSIKLFSDAYTYDVAETPPAIAISGSKISIDILKDVYSEYPPNDTWDVMGNVQITDGTFVNQYDAAALILAGWTVDTLKFTAGDIFAFYVRPDVTPLSITRVTISMTVSRH